MNCREIYKNSKNEHFKNLEKLANETSSSLIGKSISSLRYGNGKIVAFNGFTDLDDNVKRDTEISPIVKVEFESGKTALFYVNIGIKNLIITLEEEADKIVQDLTKKATKIFDEHRKDYETFKYALQKQKEAERKAAEQLEKEKKAASAKEVKIRDAQQKARALENHHIVLTNDFYTTLGFIAKHVEVISAQVPDFLEDWFRKTFPNQPYTFYDSTEKTSSSSSKKLNLSLTASLKNITDIPTGLIDYVNKNTITNTQFVYDLVDQFGFVFGEEQNLDKILATIPADKLDRFNEGFAA